MGDEDKISTWEPGYPAALHPDVISECRAAWMGDRPWSQIRALREDVDASEGAVCAGAAPHFDVPCPRPVEGVQYNASFGEPLWYCEEHALEQIENDRDLYDGPPRPRQHEFSPEEQREIQKILGRGRRRKGPPPEEEFDP